MEFLNERLKMYENFESDNTRRDVKLMFKEFDECITYVKEMASKMIRNEHRVPFESFLIKNDSMFSSKLFFVNYYFNASGYKKKSQHVYTL